MKRAVVLSGGGAKGAYELGAWRALRELKIPFHIVTGTSIGAVNAAMMVQGEYARAEGLWRTITSQDVIKSGLTFEYSLNGLLQTAGFLKNYIKNRGVDITPFRALLERELDDALFHASPIDFGLVCVKLPELKPIEVTKSQIKPGMLVDWVLASASCFPAFPICEIEGEDYIDGGYYDNQPIDTAIRLGADEVIAVGLEPKAVHPRYENIPGITHIRPSRELGSFLSFESESIQRQIAFGYQDTMKAFRRFYGFDYTFTVQNERRFQPSAERFSRRVLQLEAGRGFSDETVLKKRAPDGWLTEVLRRATTPFESFLCGVECLCELLMFPREVVYALEDMGARIEKILKAPPKGLSDTARRLSQILQRQSLRELPAREVLAALICEVL